MKKLLILSIILLSLASCKKKDYVTVELKLDNLTAADSILNVYGDQFMKVVKINKEGVFKDTLKVSKGGIYGLVVGNTQIQTFFQNGYDLKINADAKDLDKSLTFKGDGSTNSTYLSKRVSEVKAFMEKQEELFKSDSSVFYKGVNDFETKMSKLLTDSKKLDTMIINMEKKGLSGFISDLKQGYQSNFEMNKKFGKGKPSPKFVGYDNYKGGKTSLDDLKGKFVYIDVWATWCKPCIGEIPSMKALEKEYREKNIAFVSISTDKKEDYAAWKAMVKEKGMEGIQLYFNDDMTFMQAFNINSIPRFILIDPNGNIVEANAPRPSQTDVIKKLFSDSGVK